MHRRVGRRRDRRRRGRAADPALGAGRVAPVRGHDRRRRRADAPPARRAAVDDARPPRRRARARRADRGALGLGGGDLRALRLRPRLVRGRGRGARASTPRSTRRSSRAGTMRLVDADRGARDVPAALGRARRARGRAWSCARAAWWEDRALADPPERRDGAGPKRFALLESTARPAGYAIYRHRIGVRGGLVDGRGRAWSRRSPPSPRPPPGVWRFLLDIDWIATIARRAPAARPSAVLPPRAAAADALPDGRRALGAPRRRRRGALGPDVPGGRRARARGARRALPVERAPLAPRGRRRGADGRAPRTSRSTSRPSARRTSAA